MKNLKKGDIVLCDDASMCNYITKGKKYEFIKYDLYNGAMIYITSDNGYVNAYMANRFSPVKTLDAEKILEEFKEASTWIGKRVIHSQNGATFLVDDVKLFLTSPVDTSAAIISAFNEDGYAIGLKYGVYMTPHKDYKLPQSYTIDLNESYKAEVFKDKVVVGCQTFSKEKIEELYNTFKKFN